MDYLFRKTNLLYQKSQIATSFFSPITHLRMGDVRAMGSLEVKKEADPALYTKTSFVASNEVCRDFCLGGNALNASATTFHTSVVAIFDNRTKQTGSESVRRRPLFV